MSEWVWLLLKMLIWIIIFCSLCSLALLPLDNVFSIQCSWLWNCFLLCSMFLNPSCQKAKHRNLFLHLRQKYFSLYKSYIDFFLFFLPRVDNEKCLGAKVMDTVLLFLNTKEANFGSAIFRALDLPMYYHGN